MQQPVFDVVKTVGRSVESLIPGRPESARHVLQASYGYVALTAAFKQARTYANAVDRFNGKIARIIVRALSHPQDTALVNLFLPTQLVDAVGLTPLFPEVLSAYVGNTACAGCFSEAAESANVPESLCSYHKVMLGMAQTGVLQAPACIANTTVACDANQVSFRDLAERFGVPRFVVDVPNRVNERSVGKVERRLYELAAFLERSAERPFDVDAFLLAMDRTKRTLDALMEYRSLRGGVTMPTSTTGELLEMLATHLMLGSQAALDFAQDLLHLAKNAPAAHTSSKPRVFWMHTMPNWQRSMRVAFDGVGASCELVGNDMTLDALPHIDLAHPMRSLAERAVNTHFNGTGARRLENTLEQAQRCGADGVVVFCHWGCKTTLGISQLAKQRFEKAGLPTLVLDGDGCDPRNVADGQMVTRVNAFVEQLAAQRAKKLASATDGAGAAGAVSAAGGTRATGEASDAKATDEASSAREPKGGDAQ